MTNPVPPDLEVLGMTKRFGPLVALKDVNFRLRPGPSFMRCLVRTAPARAR